ncbi:NAD(P)-binding domain-containing protein [Ruegeria arenilitoris]|uniref:NAD(P)-binding domain-containing protein n=1 Tax=Ruegeria arenilitoris TaxID=1173585 RepID=UPI00147B5734|nr:NAD(P)-binding domain-containing protein [Ruegeria arenilitoris]
MYSTTTLIIGAGQCGLAMSFELSKRSIDHLVLDAGRAGENWHSRRWDSLRLLTPNWMNTLAGQVHGPDDPDGFATARQFAAEIDKWVTRHAPPLFTNTSVKSLSRLGEGYIAETNRGPIRCRSVVVATGACARPKIPVFASTLPHRIEQVSPITYRSPLELRSGGVLVVGASASGLQIAQELAWSGRKVTLAVGSHGRLPRTYRGADILQWMHLARVFDEPFTKVDDLERVRRTPSLPLIGSPERDDLNMDILQARGVELVGRMMDIRDGKAQFSGGLCNAVTSADLKMNRLLERIDTWVSDRGFDELVEPPKRFAPTTVSTDPRLTIDLSEFDTVIWATGFNPDHRFVQMPVFDRKGRFQHHGGVVEDGLYVMGLPFLRTSRSVHIDGAPRDAKALARQISGQLSQPLAA